MDANVMPKLDDWRGGPWSREVRMMVAGLGVERKTLSQALRPYMKQADESHRQL